MKLRCLLGHHFRGWVAHTDGPCVFDTAHKIEEGRGEIHIFRYCMRCRKGEHLFATINNGTEPVNVTADQGHHG